MKTRIKHSNDARPVAINIPQCNATVDNSFASARTDHADPRIATFIQAARKKCLSTPPSLDSQRIGPSPRRSIASAAWCDIADALVWPLRVVVVDEFTDEIIEMALADDNEVIKALVLARYLVQGIQHDLPP